MSPLEAKTASFIMGFIVCVLSRSNNNVQYVENDVFLFFYLKPHKHISSHQIQNIMLFLATSYDSFKKVCIGYKLAFLSRCIISNIFASVTNDLLIYTIIISRCATLLLFRKWPIMYDLYFICGLISPLNCISNTFSHHHCCYVNMTCHITKLGTEMSAESHIQYTVE